MAFRLVSSGGNVTDAAFINLAVSGVVHAGEPVELVGGAGTGGAVVGPAGVNTSQTIIFGVAQGYAQGASDTFVKVIPFAPGQIWEVDCANAATTAQVGVRQHLSAARGYIHNQATDTSGMNRVFLPIAMTGSTSGSGKLLGRFTSLAGVGGIDA